MSAYIDGLIEELEARRAKITAQIEALNLLREDSEFSGLFNGRHASGRSASPRRAAPAPRADGKKRRRPGWAGVADYLQKHKEGATAHVIAKAIGVTPSAIYNICHAHKNDISRERSNGDVLIRLNNGHDPVSSERPQSIRSIVEDLIRQQGRPAQADEIIEACKAKGRFVLKKSLPACLIALRKVGPMTWDIGHQHKAQG